MTRFTPITSHNAVIGKNIKNTGIFKNPILKGKFALNNYQK